MYPQPIFQQIKLDPEFPVRGEIMKPWNRPTVMHCHWHPSIELIRITKGNATMYIGTHSFELNEGDFCIVNPNEIHYATTDSEDKCFIQYIVLSYDILELSPESRQYKKYIEPLHRGYLLFPNQVKSIYHPYMTTLLDLGLKQFDGWELSIQSAFLMLLSKFHETNGLITIRDQPTQPALSRENHILTYFEQHFTENLSIATIAGHFALSEDYFYKLFKKVAGQTPTNYIHYLRTQYAKQLLSTTESSVSDIGEQVGYDSTSYFIKIFKRMTNTTPLSYRRKHLD